MYRLKCLFRQKVLENGCEVIVQSNERQCLKVVGINENVEALRHSFEDRPDIVSCGWMITADQEQSVVLRHSLLC